jgi:peptidoglycan/LPS O-acetylase OafA/YrhL
MPLFIGIDLNTNEVTHAAIQRPRLAALTGLRFFAAFYVMALHTATQSVPHYQAPKLWLIFVGHGERQREHWCRRLVAIPVRMNNGR